MILNVRQYLIGLGIKCVVSKLLTVADAKGALTEGQFLGGVLGVKFMMYLNRLRDRRAATLAIRREAEDREMASLLHVNVNELDVPYPEDLDLSAPRDYLRIIEREVSAHHLEQDAVEGNIPLDILNLDGFGF